MLELVLHHPNLGSMSGVYEEGCAQQTRGIDSMLF